LADVPEDVWRNIRLEDFFGVGAGAVGTRDTDRQPERVVA
jgi:hypothetical protein